MKNLTDWLNANTISLPAQETELLMFKHQRKKLDCEVKFKLNRKRLYPKKSVKYLGIRIDKKCLNWKHHVSDIAVKLNRAYALLFKIRNFFNVTALKTIYYAIFDSNINYANVIWAQNFNAVNRVSILQKKTLRNISFQPRNCHSIPLSKKQNLLKFEDKFNLKMCCWSLNTLIIYYDQFLTNGSHFALVYIIITQLPPLLVNYSSHQLIYMEKIL